jgi:hypothetical protein
MIGVPRNFPYRTGILEPAPCQPRIRLMLALNSSYVPAQNQARGSTRWRRGSLPASIGRAKT